MIRPNEIERQEMAVGTLVELTSVFEGIASMKIAKVKNQVQQAGQFFNELWHIYTQLRVGESFNFGRERGSKIIDKELFVVITAEGGFSGDIDQKLIDLMIKSYDKTKHDIVVIGHHGAVQLAQRGIAFRKYFKLPENDENIDVTAVVKEALNYKSTTVFYQEYISLMIQDVRRIELSTAVQKISAQTVKKEEIITEDNYIFEPSTYAVVDHLERSMMQIAIAQTVLDSKLAQYASRFRAMTMAHEKSDESKTELHMQFNRAKRAIKDERLKEIINGLRKSRVGALG